MYTQMGEKMGKEKVVLPQSEKADYITFHQFSQDKKLIFQCYSRGEKGAVGWLTGAY
jgi:hypothetical protein